jgi:hypothetical protein
MTKRHHTKWVRVGLLLAEVDVELIETDNDWCPCLSLEDTYKLDDVREALRRGDIQVASRLGRVYSLTSVSA